MLNTLKMNMKIFCDKKNKEGVLEHKVINLSLGVLLGQRIGENLTMSIKLHT